jgi:hypothetical protein
MREFRILDDVMCHWHVKEDHEAKSAPTDMGAEPPDGRELRGVGDEAQEHGDEVGDLDPGAPE